MKIPPLEERLAEAWKNWPVRFMNPTDAEFVALVRPFLAEAWYDAAEQTADWMASNPGPSGIPRDPPTNPYDR